MHRHVDFEKVISLYVKRSGQMDASSMSLRRGQQSANPTTRAVGDSSRQGQDSKGPSYISVSGDRIQQSQNFDASTFQGLLGILESPGGAYSIASSCAAVEECLRTNKDNLRGFFEHCFAPLVAKIFGYTGTYSYSGSQGGWLNSVTYTPGREDDAGLHFGKGGVSIGKSSISYQQGGSHDVQKLEQKRRKNDDAIALRRLLSPQGCLFAAMYNADCDGTIQFHFPKQRLPTITQMLMKGSHQMLKLWPQYAVLVSQEEQRQHGGGMDVHTQDPQHLHVSVFQYFCYWFAFYAINASVSGSSEGRRRGPSPYGAGSNLQNFGKRMLHLNSSIAATMYSSRSSKRSSEVNMYLVVLRDLLHEFLPRPVDASEDEGLLHMPSNGQGAASSSSHRSYQGKSGSGMLLYSILLEFWLKDPNEIWLTENASSLSSRRATWGSLYEPPSENILEAVNELTKYVLVYIIRDANVPAQSGSSWLPVSPVLYEPQDVFAKKDAPSAHPQKMMDILQGTRSLGVFASIGPQAYSRQLYRMLHRAFSSWPDQRSIKPLLRVFMAVIAPWKSDSSFLEMNSKSHTSKLSNLVKSVGLDSHVSGAKRDIEYSSVWENHVLSHLPFYLVLVPMFLELSISRVGTRGETSVNDVMRVISVFDSSDPLVQLLREVEHHANKCYASQPRRADGPHAEILPWVLEQTENWKRFAMSDQQQSSPAMTDFPMDGGKKDKLFSMFSTRVPCAAISAHEIQRISAGILKKDAQKSLERSFAKLLPLDAVGMDDTEYNMHGGADYGGDIDFRGVRKISRNTWTDAKFKGDDLKRPRTSYEIAYLVDFMVSISEKLNGFFGLDIPYSDKEIPETIIQEALLSLRRKNKRINLRPLSDIRNVLWGWALFWLFRTAIYILTKT